jgi:hypothetical protein
MDPIKLTIQANAARALVDAAAAVTKPPKAVIEACAALDEASTYNTEAAPDVAFEALTITKAGVRDLVDRVAHSASTKPARMEAAAELVNHLGRRLIREVRGWGSEVIEAFAGPWSDAAATFANAHAQLPRPLDDAALVRGGPGVLAAYQEAEAAAVTLTALAAHRDGLADLGVRAPGARDVESGTRYCTPASIEAAQRAQVARGHGALGRWPAILEAQGVTGLRWHSIAEQAALIPTLGHEPQEQLVARSDGFGGRAPAGTAATAVR